MDYTKRAVALCLTTLVVLFAISFIPPQKIFGVEMRRINVLSEITEFSSDVARESAAVELEINEAEYAIDMEQVDLALDSIDLDSVEADHSVTWIDDAMAGEDSLLGEDAQAQLNVEQSHPVMAPRVELKRRLPATTTTPIEDFSSDELTPLNRFYRKMLSPDSMVHVALLGDSFVEADILSADLREALQEQFGGQGVGFAPAASPLTAYRQTIKTTTSSGWDCHNIMQRTKTPEPFNKYFAVSGWVSLPSNGASTQWHTTSTRSHIESCSRVRILLLSTHDSSVEVVINGARTRTFDFKASTSLRHIELTDNNITSVKMTVTKGAEGFVAYGATFEGTSGVVVDNYSIRSNNGQAMLWTSPVINAQIDKAIGGYDLVILQYGLNIMQKGVNRYTNYGAQVEKMITYARKCFPRAAILVMGVSDRSMRESGEFVPMKEAPILSSYQREAAQNCGAAYWDTYSAMQAQGGMSGFVAQGWAGKDYTHINFAGGRQVAWALYDAMIAGASSEQGKMVIRRPAEESIIDHKRDAKIRAKLASPRTK